MFRRLTQQVSDAFLPHPPAVTGVAVSGGGDSVALLHLMHGFCTLHGTKVRAVTVNHGLRPEAETEAQSVADFCERHGIAHDTLHWSGWDGTGNLQNEARKARYGLIAGWAKQHEISTVALGHTADDQAETLLMRLARRAGVDGLSGMAPRMTRHSVIWVRPLLRAGRTDLRDYLLHQNIKWIDDPSNEDPSFERVRTREALKVLEPLGIDAQGLAQVAGQMAEARKALNWQCFLVARDIVSIDAGAVVIEERQLRVQPDEIQRRLIVQALSWISGEEYPARRGAVSALMGAMRKGQAGTADGCQLRRVGGEIWIFREYKPVSAITAPLQDLWDGRWELTNEDTAQGFAGLHVGVLGEEGLAACPNWRQTGRPHPALLSTPAVWRGDELVAAPLAGYGQNWHAEVDGGAESFYGALLSH
jgi:tRNA(Ile)-lysidine synthase